MADGNARLYSVLNIDAFPTFPHARASRFLYRLRSTHLKISLISVFQKSNRSIRKKRNFNDHKRETLKYSNVMRIL